MDMLKLRATLGLDSEEYEQGIKKASGSVDAFSKFGAFKFGVIAAAGKKAFDLVASAVSSNMDGAIKRLDTLNNFPKVMQSLGFSASDAEKGIDALANGIDHLPTTLDAVASQAQQFVPMTGNIEKATQVTLALNNAMAAGGKDAETQQRAIEQWTKAMAKGKPDFEMWQSMVQTAPAQMDQLAKSMLGAEAGQNDLYEAMKSGSISIDAVNDKMIELTNSSEGFDIAGRHYDNFAKQAENASAGIQMSMTNTKAAIQRNLANIMDAFNTTTESIGGISGIISSTIPAINALGSTISGMLTGDISFEDGMMSLMNSFSAGARQAISKGGELISNLMKGMADAAPALTEQGFVIISNIMQSIGNALPSLLSSGAELIGGIVQGVTEGIPYFVEGFSSIFSTLTEIVGEQGQAFIEKGLDLVLGLSESLREGAGNLVDSGLQLVMSLAQGLADSLPALIEKVPLIVSNIAGIINDNAPKLLSTGINIIVTLGKGLIQAIPTLIANIPQILKAMWDVFTAFQWLSLGKTVITAVGRGLKAAGKSLPNTLKSLGKRAWNAFKSINWGSAGRTAINLLVSGIRGLFSLVPNVLRTLGRAGMNAFRSINWLSLGKSLVQGIIRGVVSMVGALGNAVANLVKSAFSRGQKAADSHSPSRLFRYGLGVPIGQGLALGVTDTTPMAKQAITDVISAMEGAATMPGFNLTSANMSQGARQTLSDVVQVQVAELMSSLPENISEAMEGLTVTLDRRIFGKMTRKAAAGGM